MRYFRLSAYMGVLAAAALSVCPGSVAAAEQRYRLIPKREAGDLARVLIEIKAAGTLKLVQEDEVETLQMNVKGQFSYDEKYLSGGIAIGDSPESIRFYDRAEAKIQIHKTSVTPALRSDMRLVRVVTEDNALVLYSPRGPFTRDELELLDLPAPSLLIDGLLPSEPVAVDDTWKHGEEVVAALLRLDAVAETDLQSRLVEVTDGWASMELTGHVSGAVGGVSTEIELKGKYRFDRHAQMVTWLALLTKENRSIGHVAPGLEAVGEIELKRSPLAEWKHADPPASDVTQQPKRDLRRLRYESQKGNFRLLHDREWHVVSEESDRVALRLVDRGELVAQCNVSTLPRVRSGDRTPLARFQRDIQQALGEHFGQFVAASETSDEKGRAVYRVIAKGQASELPIRWNYYLIADQHGRQMVLVFTMEGGLVKQFGDADAPIVQSADFLGEVPQTDGRAAPSTAKAVPSTSAKR